MTDPLHAAAQAVEYIKGRVWAEPTLAWPGEIDNILDDAAALAATPPDRSIDAADRRRGTLEADKEVT